MKIFLDTNVVLDWLLERENCFFIEAKQIITLAETKKIDLLISTGSLFTITYLLEKTLKNSIELRKIIKSILTLIKIQNATQIQFSMACENGINDLEDAFQFEIANTNKGIDYFITGNLKDFKNVKNKKLKVLSPIQFLKLLNKK